MSAFAHATAFGWRGDVPGIVHAGMDYLNARYRRDDGFYRTLVGADGVVLDDRALRVWRVAVRKARRGNQRVRFLLDDVLGSLIVGPDGEHHEREDDRVDRPDDRQVQTGHFVGILEDAVPDEPADDHEQDDADGRNR